MKRIHLTRMIAAAGCACLLLTRSFTVYAETTKEERIAANQAMEIQSNRIENWPLGPTVSAASAILMEIETGTILYEKNIHDHHYPASTTKILTTLIASERSSLSEIVTFSHDAVFGIPRGSNHVAMDVGDTLTMEQCLNAILIRSANEVSYAVAEHIGGSFEGFAEIMNERAAELGCVDSHFVNPNGLPDEDHYTSAYDLAMIGRAFFANDMLCRITTTSQLIIPKEKEDLVEWNQMELIPGRKYAYEYLVGCKTGYTNDARSTLVSCAEKNGLKLICVVLQDENPQYYEDTIALFDYGFSNFDKVNVSQTETKYNIENVGFFYSDNDIFGTSKPILSLNKQDCIVVPKTVAFNELTSAISYETESEDQAAIIAYSYHGVPLGTASVDLTVRQDKTHTFDKDTEEDLPEASDSPSPVKTSFIFINILKMTGWIIGIGILAFLIFLGYALLKSHRISFLYSGRHLWKRRRRRQKKHYQASSDIQASRRAQIRAVKRRYRKRSRR